MSPVSPRDGQLVRGGHLPPTENCSRQPLASAPSLPSKAPIGSNRLSAHAALPVLHADRSGNANIRKRASKSQRMIDRWLQEKTSTYFRTAQLGQFRRLKRESIFCFQQKGRCMHRPFLNNGCQLPYSAAFTSALLRIAASRTSAATCSSNFAKFFSNRLVRFAAALS